MKLKSGDNWCRLAYFMYVYVNTACDGDMASSVARSLKISTRMADHQGRLGAAHLCPFVGVDLNL